MAETIEFIDYYLEPSGLMVFTREYHLKRGYCCESRCRHCPYGFNPKALPTPDWVLQKACETTEKRKE